MYGSRYVARKRRKLSPQHSVKVPDTRLYSRYTSIAVAFEEVGIVCEEHESPEEYSQRARRSLTNRGGTARGDLPLRPLPQYLPCMNC